MSYVLNFTSVDRWAKFVINYLFFSFSMPMPIDKCSSEKKILKNDSHFALISN